VLIVSVVVEGLARRLFPAAHILALPTARPSFLGRFLPLFLRARSLLASVHFNRMVCLRHQRTAATEVLLASLHYNESFGVANDSRWLNPEEGRYLPSAIQTQIAYPTSASRGHCTEIEAHRRVLELCLGRAVKNEEVTPVLARTAGCSGGALVFCPFSSTVVKDYPATSWMEVFSLLAWKGPIHLCGSPADIGRLGQFAETLRSRGLVAHVIPTADLDGLIAIIADATAVLGVDSAPAHFATAMDRPGVFLVGGSHWGMFAPWQRSARQIWLTHELPCFRCNWECPYPTIRCITEIPPAEIACALDSILNTSTP
ncbi:MAG: glycosyltransferase family 9 protein, partial [Verrucomicrobiaceae bacterium]